MIVLLIPSALNLIFIISFLANFCAGVVRGYFPLRLEAAAEPCSGVARDFSVYLGKDFGP
jgi:hypothetical protein